MLASVMKGVDDIMLTLGVQGNNSAAHMEAQCSTPQDAVNVASQLKAFTSLLKGAIEREKKKPDAKDRSRRSHRRPISSVRPDRLRRMDFRRVLPRQPGRDVGGFAAQTGTQTFLVCE